jgi:hypothetical protein
MNTLARGTSKGVIIIASRDFNEVHAITRRRSMRYYKLAYAHARSSKYVKKS